MLKSGLSRLVMGKHDSPAERDQGQSENAEANGTQECLGS